MAIILFVISLLILYSLITNISFKNRLIERISELSAIILLSLFTWNHFKGIIIYLYNIINEWNIPIGCFILLLIILLIVLLVINYKYINYEYINNTMHKKFSNFLMFIFSLVITYIMSCILIPIIRFSYNFIISNDEFKIKILSISIIFIDLLIVAMCYGINHILILIQNNKLKKSLVVTYWNKHIKNKKFRFISNLIVGLFAIILICILIACYSSESLASTLNNHVVKLSLQENCCDKNHNINETEKVESPSNNCVEHNIHLENKLIECHNKKNKDYKHKIIHIYHIRHGHLIYYVNNKKLKSLLNGSKHAKFYLYKIQNNKLCFKYDSHIAGSANVNIKLNLELNKK